MTSEAIEQWIIAVLLGTPAVVAHWTGANRVGPHDTEGFPSAEGVWVTSETEGDTDRIVDDAVFRIYVVKKGRRTDCSNAMMSIREALNFRPGEPKTWAVTPASKNLRVKNLRMIMATGAEKNGDGAGAYYSGVLRYRVKGRSTLLTA